MSVNLCISASSNTNTIKKGWSKRGQTTTSLQQRHQKSPQRQPPTANAFDGLSARKNTSFRCHFSYKNTKMGEYVPKMHRSLHKKRALKYTPPSIILALGTSLRPFQPQSGIEPRRSTVKTTCASTSFPCLKIAFRQYSSPLQAGKMPYAKF
jgi:hypothetical protein